MSDWIEIVEAGAVPPGAFTLASVEGVELALFNVDGSYHCIENLCTHDGGNLVEGDVTGCIVTCPRHGAQFDVRTGKAVKPPATGAAATFAVRVLNGKVEVRIDALPEG